MGEGVLAVFGKTSPVLPIEEKVWASLDKYAGIEREVSLADLVFAIYIEQRSKFAALMLLRMSRASEIGEISSFIVMKFTKGPPR